MSAPLIGGNPKLFAPKARKIQIDIDPFELKEENKISIDLKINSNLKDFVKLLKKEKNLWSTNKSWIKHINDLKNKYLQRSNGFIASIRLFKQPNNNYLLYI